MSVPAFRDLDPRSETGFTLIEMLITAVLMIIMLIAVASLLDSGQSSAARDNERSQLLSETNSGVLRLTTELRRACAVFPSTGGSSSTYCGSTTSFAPGTDLCNTSPASNTNCIDFILPSRPSVGQSWSRVIYNCSVADPTGASGVTDCVRYATATTSTQTALATAPTTAAANTPTTVIRGVSNSAGVAGSSTNPPIFTYCLNTDLSTSSCASPVASAQVIRTTLNIARTGTRKVGLQGNFRYDDAVDLKNINRDQFP